MVIFYITIKLKEQAKYSGNLIARRLVVRTDKAILSQSVNDSRVAISPHSITAFSCAKETLYFNAVFVVLSGSTAGMCLIFARTTKSCPRHMNVMFVTGCTVL